jgi:hypothetical protein
MQARNIWLCQEWHDVSNGLEVLTAVNIKITFFSDMTPCNLVEYSSLKIEGVGFSETLVLFKLDDTTSYYSTPYSLVP